MQGLCVSKINEDRGVIISKAIVTVNNGKLVPVKILNFTNEIVHVNKGQILADLELLSKEHICVSVSDDSDTHFVQNIQLAKDKLDIKCETADSKFLSYFNLPDRLSEQQKACMVQLLQSHKEIFVTDENPNLGYTDIVKHNICLNPNF